MWIKHSVLQTWFIFCLRESQEYCACAGVQSLPHWSQGRQRIYMDPSPNRSGGRNELREEGVARSTSAPHRDAPPGAEPPHNWLALPPDQVSLLLPRDQVLLTLLAPPPLLLLAPLAARCARMLCTSASLGASAKMVVLFRMQLFRLPCA